MDNISQIDNNFKVETKIDKEDIVFHSIEEAPFRTYGVSFENGRYRRLPEAVAKTVSDKVHALCAHTAGGRVRFCTDSPYIAIHAKMPVIGKMPHFALTGSAGFDLYADNRYIKTFVPPFTVKEGYESVVELGEAQMREITIHFPLYSAVSALYIGIKDKAELCHSRPYKNEKPIVYYGSSITQGGCASRPGNCYTNILSRKLDSDYINLGFSGSARAEDEIAQYIKDLDMSVFVYDYDHNAPTADHLEKTHERMFQTIRQANPDLPIVIMSRPKCCLTEVEKRRLGIIKNTYENARAQGDANVYLLDGSTLMALAGEEGTVDGCHPNDLGFASMARALEPVLAEILSKM